MRDLKEYFRPASAEEAVKIKREYGKQAVYLAGATDLLVHRPESVQAAIDIRHADIGYVRVDGGDLAIGGAALLRDVEAAADGVAGGMLRIAVRHTAPWLIRNVATLAGNLVNASPAADSVPALLALDARVVLMGDGDEEVGAGDILVRPHVTNIEDRLLREIRIPAAALGRRAAFTKLERSKSDIALVNLAVAADLEDGVARKVRIALGAVAPTAMRATQTEALLEGQTPGEDLLREAEALVRQEVRPISDWRASEDYRRRMSGVLVRRALARIFGIGDGASDES